MLQALKQKFDRYYTNFEEFVTRNESDEAIRINKKMSVFYTHCLAVFYVIYPFFNPFTSISQTLIGQFSVLCQFLALLTRSYPLMVSSYVLSAFLSLFMCSLKPLDGLKSIAIVLIQHNYSFFLNKYTLLRVLYIIVSFILVNQSQINVHEILDKSDLETVKQLISNLQYAWPPLYLINTTAIVYLTNKYWKTFQSKQEAQKALEQKNQELFEVNQKLQATLKLLEQTNKDLKDAMSARELFIASVSHELRNPLNSMLGNIELLSLDIKDPKCQNMLDSCKICGEVLLGLINNVLDVAKINAEKLELHIESENLHRVIEKAWVMSTIKMRQKGIKGHLLIGNSVPKYVEIDTHRLNQILLNLIGNATKFTQRGFIKVIVTWIKDGDIENLDDSTSDELIELILSETQHSHSGMALNIEMDPQIGKMSHNQFSIPSEISEYSQVSNYNEMQRHILNRTFINKRFSHLKAMSYTHFTENDIQIQQKLSRSLPQISKQKGILKIEVIDSGCGITTSSLKQLFNPFSQADSSVTSRFGGTGLGLYITKQLVQKMGGQIHVQSHKNVGSKFWMGIPIQTSFDRQNEMQLQEDNTKNTMINNSHIIRALIVDDDPLNQLILINYLNKLSIQSDVASNGQEALEKFKKRVSNYYSFIISDIEMPIMDGLSACKAIRKYEQEKKITPSCPIVMITANCSDAKRKQCLNPEGDIRAHSFFRKPFTFQECQTFTQTLIQ